MERLLGIASPGHCEAAAGAAAGPIAALSSLVIVAAAWLALRQWRREAGGDRGTLLLIVCVLLAGVASLAAHGVGRPLHHYASAIPIGVLALGVLALSLTRFFRQGPAQAVLNVLGLAGLAGLAVLMLRPPFGEGAWLALSLSATHALGALLVLRGRQGLHRDGGLTGERAARSNALHYPQIRMGYALVQSGLVLATGLVARAYGAILCGPPAAGLDAAWHVIAACAVLILLRAAIRNLAAPQAAPQATPDASAGRAPSTLPTAG